MLMAVMEVMLVITVVLAVIAVEFLVANAYVFTSDDFIHVEVSLEEPPVR